MKKINIPETKISKVSLALVIKLAISVLMVAFPIFFTYASEISIPLWIVGSMEVITILILMVYAVVPKVTPKQTFSAVIPISIFLILATRVVFLPPISNPLIKYTSQILCIAAICFLVELNRYIGSYKTFKWIAWTIFGLLLISSALETLEFMNNPELGSSCITGLWMVLLTVICVLITYEATIKKRNTKQ